MRLDVDAGTQVKEDLQAATHSQRIPDALAKVELRRLVMRTKA